MSSRLAFAICWAVVGAGCAPLEGEPNARSRSQSGIVGGTIDSGDPEVFILAMEFSNGSLGVCSATLIGRRTLITAAHCVDPRVAGASSVSIRASNETSVAGDDASEWIPVVAARVHPEWDPRDSLDNDVGLALLDVSPVAPSKPWSRDSLSQLEGKPVRAVGYGITAMHESDAGVKREVELIVNLMDPDHLYLGDGLGKGICHGDSGGPSFHRFADGVERLVGIHSFATNRDCTEGADVRIAVHAEFVDQWMADYERSRCGADGVCKRGCTPVDIDCACAADGACTEECADLAMDPDCPADCSPNGVCAEADCPRPDMDCVAVGEPCSVALQCRSRMCVGDPQRGPYCSETCSSSSECEPGMECAPDTGACVRPPLPEPVATEAPNPDLVGDASDGAGCSEAGAGPLVLLSLLAIARRPRSSARARGGTRAR
jgi:hypothetical protein